MAQGGDFSFLRLHAGYGCNLRTLPFHVECLFNNSEPPGRVSIRCGANAPFGVQEEQIRNAVFKAQSDLIKHICEEFMR